jgi:hypothetical protein
MSSRVRDIQMPSPRRRRARQSTLSRALEEMKTTARSATRSGAHTRTRERGAAGFALIAGIAGLAVRNRNKLASLFSKKRDDTSSAPSQGTMSSADGGAREPGLFAEQ